MSQIIKPDHAELTWQGSISFQRDGSSMIPWRIPYDKLELFPPDALLERAEKPAGVRISFYSNTVNLSGEIGFYPEPEDQDSFMLDLLCDGSFHSSIEFTSQTRFDFHNLPNEEKLIELWLPQFMRFELKHLEIDDGSSIRRYEDNRPKWITYGSSITHCRAAERASQTWPALVAREHGLNLTCLGYGGNCHLEPMIARMIRDMPADFISMKIGINIYGSASMSIRTFMSSVIGFIEIIREKHRDTPLAVISPIYSLPREETLNAVEMNLQIMRNEISQAVSKMQSYGDTNIHYIDGLSLFNSNHSHLLPDTLHPNAEGYKILAQNFLKEVAVPLFKK
jgi:hypothetical protein